MKKAKKILTLMLAVLTISTCIPVSAAALNNNLDDILFDAEYYARENSDVVNALGRSESALRGHFQRYGKAEGRAPSALFNPRFYSDLYPDIKATFGDNWSSVYNHFKTYGIKEGRQGSSSFSVEAYKTQYQDLQNAFGTNPANNYLYLKHWREYGRYENRITTPAVSTPSAPTPDAPPVPSGRTVEDGKYYIVSALDNQKALDIAGGSILSGGNLQLYKCNNSGAQLFQITYSNKGYYTIKNVNSGLVLDLAGGGTTPGTNVQQYKKNSSTAQQFYFEDAGDGYYYIRSACGLYIDVSGGNTANGTNVQGWSKNESNAQKFRLVSYVNYTYKTVSLDCSSVNAWISSLLESQENLDGLIVAQDILSYKMLKVKTAIGPSWNGNSSYRTDSIRLPNRVKYKLHSHTFNEGYGHSWRLSDGYILFQDTCNCGYYAEKFAWEIPDLTEMAGTQTSRSVVSRLPQINK